MRNHNESDVIAMLNSVNAVTVRGFEQVTFEADLADAIKQIHNAHVPICRMVGNRSMPDGTSEMCMEVSEHLQNAMRVLKEIESFGGNLHAAPISTSLGGVQAARASDHSSHPAAELLAEHVKKRGPTLRAPDLVCRSCEWIGEWEDGVRMSEGHGETFIYCPECGGDVDDVEQV